MLDHMSRRPSEIDALARQFAELHAAMHDVRGSGLPDQKANLRWAIERAAGHLPDGALDVALSRLNALPGGLSICHGDMHPGNVLITAERAVIIDWITAGSGSPAGDVARTLFLLRDSVIPGYVPEAQLELLELARRRFASVYLDQYRRLRPLDADAATAWRLPILCARLAEDIEAERAPLEALISAEIAARAAG